MLKKRIIPVQLLLGDRLVKTVKFDSYRDVGNPISSSKVYCNQDADELVLLNIDRKHRDPKHLVSFVEKVSEVVFMPLAVGGGITQFDQAQKLFESGVDKVILNSSAYNNPKLLTEIARSYGSQAVVISIDARKKGDQYELFSHCGLQGELVSLTEHIRHVEEAGAGELFINSIDQDGQMNGYDLNLIQRVADCTNLPVIACGGAGSFEHMKEAFLQTHVDALACGSLFNFGDNNPIRAKAFLSNHNLNFKIL